MNNHRTRHPGCMAAVRGATAKMASHEARLLQAKVTAKVLSKKVHCRSLSSIHILYNHDPVQALYSLPGQCTQLVIFNWTEVVLRI